MWDVAIHTRTPGWTEIAPSSVPSGTSQQGCQQHRDAQLTRQGAKCPPSFCEPVPISQPANKETEAWRPEGWL